MNDTLLNLYFSIFPQFALEFVHTRKSKFMYLNLRRDIINYVVHNQKCEMKEELAFIKENGIESIPYQWVREYRIQNVEAHRDTDGYPYVIHNGKKLYGKQNWPLNRLRAYYRGLLCEQDERSPHKYLKSGRYPSKGSVVADVGAAEGIFALDILEYAQKIYLFEGDTSWIRALEKTFSPWSSKIEIIDKYVGDVNDEKYISLDNYFRKRKCDYVKADIEGMEEILLDGGEKTFQRKVKQCLFCIYHRTYDEQTLTNKLMSMGFSVDINSGYMLFLPDINNLHPPFFRHGVFYAKRDEILPKFNL